MSSSDRAGALKLSVAENPGSASLQRLKHGELTLEEYLDERVELAMERMKGLVAPTALEDIRRTLREKFRTDPVFVSAIEQATGQTLPLLTHTGKN